MKASDLLVRALAAVGIGETSIWLAIKGNDVTTVHIRSITSLRAKIGDRVETDDGGFIEKISSDGWCQWKWYGPGDPAIPPLRGQVLRWTPASLQAPSDGPDQGKSA